MKKIFVCLLMLWGSSAIADQNHYLDLLVGDRASGMGGAYTAVSDDPTGMYYNPAGIVYSPDTNTSASSLAYQTQRKRYTGAIGGNDWVRNSSSFVPNFFGVLQPMGNGGYFGLSYAMSDALNEHQSQKFTNITGINEFSINLDDQDTTYKLGPTYAARINDSWSYGITLYVHLRNRNASFNQVADYAPTPTAGQYDWTNQQITTNEVGINPILGVMWTPTEKSSLGLSVRKTFIISSLTQLECTKQASSTAPNGTICGSDFSAGDYVHVMTSNHNYTDPPWEVALGWASFPNNKEVYSSDLKLYTGGDFTPTWNASFGYEHFFSAKWNSRFGVYTNNANTGVPSGSDTYPVEHVDELGVSASIGRFTRTSSVSIGIAYVNGSGLRSNLTDASTGTVPVFVNATTLYLTAYYTN
jgi:long-chain fatty acid transport protein